MQIIINHPELTDQETPLSADVAAAATSSTVENNTGFATNDYTVFGTLGEELTEIVKLTSTTGTTTLGHTTGPVFAHSARTPVALIKYNQAKIYTDTSEDGLFATLLATVDLTLDQDATVYDDTTGTTATWYKIKYYNSTSTGLSSFSVAVLGTGYTDDSLFSMTEEVMEEFGDSGGKDLSKDEVHRQLRGGVRRVALELFKTYPDYFKTYAVITPNGTGSDSLPSRFIGLIRADINSDGTSTTGAYKAGYVEESSGAPSTTYFSASPKISIRGSSLITLPTLGTGGRVFMWYWAYPAEMTTESSEHGLPYGARDVLKHYALYKIWIAKDTETGVGTRGYAYRTLFKEDLENYVEFVSQSRQQLNSRKIDIAFGSDLYEY
jgi:hypothetical protein